MSVKVIALLVGSILSAILYRAGGMSKDPDAKPTWMPMWMRNTKFRDMGCPTVWLGTLLFWWRPDDWMGWILLLMTWGAMFGALTTYWDFLFNDKDNFFMHGFVIGLSTFFLVGAGLHWWGVLAYSVSLALLMGGWSALVGWDIGEEMGRGVVIPLCLPLLLI